MKKKKEEGDGNVILMVIFYESKKSVGGEIRCFFSSRLKTLVEIYVRMPLIF